MSFKAMATVTHEVPRRDQYRFIIGAAGTRYTILAMGLILGLPVIAYLSGSVTALFYVHIGLAAFWFGMDFFFRYVLAPAVDASGPETAASLLPHLSPRIMVVGESLTLGTIGSGIGLAQQFGYLTTPPVWVWGALAIAAVMIYIAFVPLHHYQTELLFELDSAAPNGERVETCNEKALGWLTGMTGLFLLIILMMVGMRGLIA
jgi:hypothetical protein